MPCDPGSAFDLCVLVLLLCFDHDKCLNCCDCLCKQERRKHILYALRFLIHELITFIQVGILVNWNSDPNFKFIDALTSESKVFYVAGIVSFGLFSTASYLYMMFACCCKRQTIVTALLIICSCLMLLMDIFMLVFSFKYGLQQGQKAFDNSDAGNRVRLAVTVLSILDIGNAFVGLIILIWHIIYECVANRVRPYSQQYEI